MGADTTASSEDDENDPYQVGYARCHTPPGFGSPQRKPPLATTNGLDSEEPSAEPGPSASSTEADLILDMEGVLDNLGSDDLSEANSSETVIDASVVRRKKRKNKKRYLRRKRMRAL